MRILPSLRTKIRRSFTILIALYGGLGVLLLLAVLVASGTTPKAIHQNYDSIVAMGKMEKAWTALRSPPEISGKKALSPVDRQAWDGRWEKEFEDALRFEESNITEPNELETARQLRKSWNAIRGKVAEADPKTSLAVRTNLEDLVRLNEAGMFGLAEGNTRLSRGVLVGGLVFLLVTIVLSILLADSLATRLALPLKSIAELLHSKPAVGRKLRLPDATSLEILILNDELAHLWNRVGQIERLNFTETLRQKGKLEVVLDSVEDALLVLDGSGEVSHCSASMLSLIGLIKDQVIGNLWVDLPVNSENYFKLRDVLQEDVPEGREIELKTSQDVRQFAIRSRKIESPGWSHSGKLYLLHDITEKRQRDRLRAQLIDLLSHELKTPLQSLGTASEILVQHREELSEELRLMVDTIAEDAHRIRAVANEFIQVTQPHSKVLKLRFERVALNDVVSEWIKPFRVVARDRDVKIEVLHEGSSLIQASIDLVKFPWVISNLLSNAIRFSPKGGQVAVIVTDRNGFAEIKVRDEGPGVPSDEQSRIFDPFYQSRMTQQDGRQGLFGVGLTIAREVVEAHDGRIEYHPNSPHGSVFRILLPLPEMNYG